MIALVLAMVWVRRAQAVTLALLSMFAVAAAVAAPAYVVAADQAVAAGQVRTARPAERGVELSASTAENDGSDASSTFDDVGSALADLPGFDIIYATEYATIGAEATDLVRTRFVHRQDVCAHLSIVSGRCLIGEGEVVIGEQAAKRLNLRAGSPVVLTYAEFSSDPQNPRFVAAGLPKPLTVAGIYRPADPTGTYWGVHGYFAPDAGDRPGEPFFTTVHTMDAMTRGTTLRSIDGRAGPEALRADNLPALRAQLDDLTRRVGPFSENITFTSGIPELLDRIDEGRNTARLLVPVLAVPLVLLACLSIYLAVGHGIEGRRPELAVVALRGARWWSRWWLAAGESVVPILAGALLGCVAGQVLVVAVAAARYPDVEVAAGLSALRLAPAVTAAALIAALLAQRRQLLSPVADLLRRAPIGGTGVRGLALEAIVGLLALVTGLQLLLTDGELTGVGFTAPGLLALAFALLAARIALPLITRIGVRSLRRGRPGSALAALQLTRRPGAARLFTLLVAAVAVAGYATVAADVGAAGRAVTAGLGNGADRVLTVAPVSRAQLLHAVRRADPDARYAMAAAYLPGAADSRPGLAVDTTRLATVPIWPDDATAPAAVAEALRPAAGPPVVLSGQDLALDVTTTRTTPGKQLRLTVTVSSLTGLGEDTVGLGALRDGPYTYQQRSPACREGCRLKGISLSTSPGITAVTGRVQLRGLRTTAPSRDALSTSELAEVARWRVSEESGVRLTAAPGGLLIDVDAEGGLPEGAWVQAADTPDPLPVAIAGADAPATVTGFDGRAVPVIEVARLPAIPRAGGDAVLADLEYAERWATDSGQALRPQVWLSADAPPDIADRLAAGGLAIVDDVSVAQVRGQLDEQGPAVALWFYALAGMLATALAAGALVLAASVDRARRVEDLAALRAQGLSRRAVDRATLGAYPALALAAVGTGMLCASVLWRLTGWALPLAGLNPPDVPLPAWPGPVAPVVVAVVLAVVLSGVAYVAGRRTRREIG